MFGALANKHATHEVTALASGFSDEDLLEQFLNAEALDSQDAFRTLVERHGPMVRGVCRQVLRHPHDVNPSPARLLGQFARFIYVDEPVCDQVDMKPMLFVQLEHADAF